ITLAGNLIENWTVPTAGLPYILDTHYGDWVPFEVGAGVTLTVQAGTVVKIDNATKLSIKGALVINGTAAQPAVLTSYRDDSAGGDTNGDGTATQPTADLWQGILINSGAELRGTNADIRYAAVPLRLDGSTAELSSSVIRNSSSTAVQLSSGSSASIEATFIEVAGILSSDPTSNAQLRGSSRSLTGKAPFVTACAWGTSPCVVDASYFDWGSAEGPNPTGQPGMACGSVIASPWEFAGQVVGTSIWAVGNCDGSAYSPDTKIQASKDSYDAAVAASRALCAQGPEYADACQLVTSRESCLAGAKEIVASQSIFPLPDENQILGYGEAVAGAGSDVLQLSANRKVATAAERASLVLKVVQVADTFAALKSAHDGCH
uniref:hypothetical protein n=1 Tax=Arthrobacter sp. UNC362MFTsu5.1 TaxID=1449044 RepID=UPI0005BAE540